MLRRSATVLLLAMGLATQLVGCGAEGHDPRALAALEAVDAGALLVDVRSLEELADGFLEGAIHIPHAQILQGLEQRGVAKSTPIVLYCRSGNRAGIALDALERAGYSAVTNGGGYDGLRAAALALASAPSLGPAADDVVETDEASAPERE